MSGKLCFSYYKSKSIQITKNSIHLSCKNPIILKCQDGNVVFPPSAPTILAHEFPSYCHSALQSKSAKASSTLFSLAEKIKEAAAHNSLIISQDKNIKKC